jgi:hypothetical protein
VPKTNGSDPVGRSLDRRKFIAIVYADTVGYSPLVGRDDAGRSLLHNRIDRAGPPSVRVRRYLLAREQFSVVSVLPGLRRIGRTMARDVTGTAARDAPCRGGNRQRVGGL